ncbi:2ODD33 [Symbiodinium necroappetens]|uniref:phosphoglycerate mutase (2,3-diphosphoglycerate-dependent) n=1 Tax=Symbiodinium necroappetens TaxID=1628268 RepID=A0A812MKK3_9DINO|nr:2ODD33 [Symbiodinium necroappetens]
MGVLLPCAETELQAKGICTGWAQDGLSARGKEQAEQAGAWPLRFVSSVHQAGKLLTDAGFSFDALFTSVQKQAICTGWLALMQGDRVALPHIQNFRLNDRHWGVYQGKAKPSAEEDPKEAAPPAVGISDAAHPSNDPLYRGVPSSARPGSESMKMVVDRTRPFWHDAIAPFLLSGKTPLVVAHEGSVRAICQGLEDDTDAEALEYEIHPGVPLVVELDEELEYRKRMALLASGVAKARRFSLAPAAGPALRQGPTPKPKAKAKVAEPAKPKEDYTVEVTVQGAKGLRDADWFTGTSDPYVKCTVSGKEEIVGDALHMSAVRRPSTLLFRAGFLQRGSGFSSLPVVNLAPFLEKDGAASPERRAAAAQSLDDACRGVGFFYLEGHGVPAESQQKMHQLAKEFFSLPAASKEAIALPAQSSTGRGYQRLGENVTLQKRDWHEAIDFYAEPGPDAVELGRFADSPANMRESQLEQVRAFVHARNRWPEEPAGFRRHAEGYFAEMRRVGDGLMDAMAVAFGMPPAQFRGLTDRSFWCARVIGYPALSEGKEVGLSCGEHSDYGCWTILSQDDTPDALEVRFADGTWGKVQPRPGAFVINLGDMLSVWTKGRYVATRHRVRQTTREFRTSIAYFHEPNFDAEIRALEVTALRPGADPAASSLVASTGPLKRGLEGGALIYGEHLFAKVDYGHSSLAAQKGSGEIRTPTLSNIRAEVIKWNHLEKIQLKHGDSLDFTVYDEDTGKSDDFLGKCTLRFDDILQDFSGTLKLVDEKGKAMPGKTKKGAFLTVAVKEMD